MSYRIVLAKEGFKFSVAHFTIFSADRAERLHGHNYYLTVELELNESDKSLGLTLNFNDIKPEILALTESLDERVLVPALSPYLKIQKNLKQISVSFGEKNYSFPEEDVFLLPVTNITSEELGRYLTEKLSEKLQKHPHARRIVSLAIGVEETRGQSVFYRTPLVR